MADVNPLRDGHAQERAVDALAVRQAEAHVRGAAGRVDAELVAQAAEDAEDLAAGGRQRPDGHDQRVDDDVRRGMPWSAARSTIRFATANRTSGSSLMPVSSLLIATTAAPYFLISGRTRSRRSSSPVTRVHERLALVDGQAGLERLDDRGIDGQRHVGQRLDEPDGLGEDRRLVGQRDPRVHVQHVRAGLDLGDRVALDPAEVAGLHLLGQELATGRVDALADDDERPVEHR